MRYMIIILTLLVVDLLLNRFPPTSQYFRNADDTIVTNAKSGFAKEITPKLPSLPDDSARIVQEAYDKSYRWLVQHCPPSTAPNATLPSDGDRFVICFKSFWNACRRDLKPEKKPPTKTTTVAEIETSSSDDDEEEAVVCPSESIPWWFLTMMRDSAVGNGLFGAWHNLNLKPDLQACVMEKVGTKHWQALVTMQFAKRNITVKKGFFHGIALAQNKNGPTVYNRSVILRDPLERFLSAFLDKCSLVYGRGDHCEPLSVFGSTKESPMGDFYHNNRRLLFEAYVDAFPTKWNLHFLPQSFMCDGGLYRHIHQFDFVGYMDGNFYRDVARFGDRYDLREDVDQVFGVTPELLEGAQRNTGVETSAATHVLEYYSPATVRRVLELTSIDYVLLNLTVPLWAQKILREEEGVASTTTSRVAA